MDYPYLTQDVLDMDPTEEWIRKDKEEPVQYIKNMQDGSTAGYKYFDLRDTQAICLQVRGNASGTIEIRTSVRGERIGTIPADVSSDQWKEIEGALQKAAAGTAFISPIKEQEHWISEGLL